MNRFGIFSRGLFLLAFATSACVVQPGADDDAQTLESDVSSNESSEAEGEASESSTTRPFVLDTTLRTFESFTTNQGQTEGPHPQPWSDSNRGGAQPSNGSSK